MFASGCSRVLMRLTIQLNSRPYKALDMASRTSVALSTVLVRMMVSPLVTTHWEVRASWSSSEPMLRRDAAEGKHKSVWSSVDISLCAANIFQSELNPPHLLFVVKAGYIINKKNCSQDKYLVKYLITRTYKQAAASISPFSKASEFGTSLLSVWCWDVVAVNSTFPMFRIADRIW